MVLSTGAPLEPLALLHAMGLGVTDEFSGFIFFLGLEGTSSGIGRHVAQLIRHSRVGKEADPPIHDTGWRRRNYREFRP